MRGCRQRYIHTAIRPATGMLLKKETYFPSFHKERRSACALHANKGGIFIRPDLLRCVRIGLIILLFPALLSAEVYHYTDESGVIRFTDNYVEIPESQRFKVEIINRRSDTAPPEVKMETDHTPATRPPATRAESGRSNEKAGLQVPEAAAGGVQSQLRLEALIRVKANLDTLYRVLAAEKEALEKEQQTLQTSESIRAYQDKVNLFNERLADYERQRQAFQGRVEAYNRATNK